MPRGYIHHYDVSIQPDKCPRKVNREIIETMVHAFPRIFGSLKVSLSVWQLHRLGDVCWMLLLLLINTYC